MENIYNITCHWQLNKQSATDTNGNWSGQFFCKNGLLKGVVFNNDEVDSLILGAFVEDKGMEITKISTHDRTDVKTFVLSKIDSNFVGNILVETQFASNLIGNCQAIISKASIFTSDQQSLTNLYRDAKKAITNLNGLGNYFINILEQPLQINQKIKNINEKFNTKKSL